MKSLIFGVIGIVWGGIILISHFLKAQPDAAGAYGAGQTGGLILGGLFLVAGIFAVASYLKKRNRQ